MDDPVTSLTNKKKSDRFDKTLQKECFWQD